MPLFHFISVTPVVVRPGLQQQVELWKFFVVAPDLSQAWAIAQRAEVAKAAEVWAIEVQDTGALQVPPALCAVELQEISDFRRWTSEQKGYRLRHSAPESLEQWAKRQPAERRSQHAT